MDSYQRPRLYHSSSLLLPDGRVMLAGGGALDGGAPNERTIEVYSPPYLFKGARPGITSAPGTVRHGIPFDVTTPDASRIGSVALVRMGSQTHSQDQDQRYVPLQFSTGPGSSPSRVPPTATSPRPGGTCSSSSTRTGVPSVSAPVQVPLPAGDVTPPTTPANLTASGGLGSVQLNWSPSTDEAGVTEYRVHRSTSSGFTPSAGNRVATVSNTAHTDNGLSPGTYYYKVVAADAAGNTSAPSNQAQGVVTSDTTAPSVSVTSPAGGATVSGTTSVTANATDNVGVTNVEFRLDGASLGTDTSAPYSVSWDTRSAANGSHALTAVARDAAGNSTTSAPVTVTVSNTTGGGGGLVAAYGFEEASGATTADATGGGHTGTISGATRTTSGRNGRALSFDGVNDMVTVADAAALDLTTGMTLEAWVYPTAGGSQWRTGVIKEAPGDLAYSLYVRDGNGRPATWVTTSGNQNATGNTALPTNAWSHVASTYDGSQLRLFVGGTQVASRLLTGALLTSNGPLRMGGNTVWNEWLAGRMDDVRIYNRALSASEIQADSGRPAP